MVILKEYTSGNNVIKEYTKDGKTVSHIVKTLIQREQTEPTVWLLSIEEEILFETKYQTLLIEMGGM